MKIAVVTCYRQPDYVRAVSLRAAVSAAGHDLIVVKNSRLGGLRYVEVFLKLLVVRVKYRPNAYILTFRGHDALPMVNLLTWPKLLIFDELVNPLEWLEEPRPEWWARFVPVGALRVLYRMLLWRSTYVLADTEQHARYSAKITYDKECPERFFALPVSTDESVFKPQPTKPPSKPFRVFYYGSMVPLHGLQHVIAAAVSLKSEPITFKIVGGDKTVEKAISVAVADGAHIDYKSWVDYKKLPAEIHDADLCLGGPFGATTQADMVITGKTYQFLACAAPTLIGKTQAATLFTDKENCLSVPLGNAEALAKAIEWAYGHPKELSVIGKNGRKLYEEHYSISAIAPQLESILRMQRQNDQE